MATLDAYGTENAVEYKRTFPLTNELSSRLSDDAIRDLGARAGMTIPDGNDAYHWFVDNIDYYETVLVQSDPSLGRLLAAHSTPRAMMTYTDPQLLALYRPETWSDRVDLVHQIIRRVIAPLGVFSFPCNDLDVYEKRSKPIVYTKDGVVRQYSTKDVAKHIVNHAFPLESVRQLAALAREKKILWARAGLEPPELVDVLALLA